MDIRADENSMLAKDFEKLKGDLDFLPEEDQIRDDFLFLFKIFIMM